LSKPLKQNLKSYRATSEIGNEITVKPIQAIITKNVTKPTARPISASAGQRFIG